MTHSLRCGCGVRLDSYGTVHVYSCRDDCPNHHAILQFLRLELPDVPETCVRSIETILGRELTDDEINARHN